MKIKTWLLTSYLVVMILPLIAVYVLFAWINSYNNDQKVAEFIETSNELQEIKNTFNDPSFYRPADDIVQQKVEEMSSHQQTITLYNAVGFTLYSTNPVTSLHYVLPKKQLYDGLYELKQGYSKYSYKEPVFRESEVVGFYEVELSRDKWVSGVSERSLFMFIALSIFFILLYIVVIRLVNRKLNKRLTHLKEEMTSFADGITVEETVTNNDEIGELKRHFYNMRNQINTARANIEEEQRKKEYMIATISHDLKTPLTSIKAYAEALDLTDDLSEGEQEEYKQVIIDKSDFMKQMLDDLLMYALLQSSTYEMDLVEVDGDEFFDMLVSDYEELCKKRHIRLCKYSDVTGSYMVSPKQMMRVADNLTSNAIQHTERGKQIWIAALSNGEESPNWLFEFTKKKMQMDGSKYVYFIVQNEGKGISADKLKQIFDPLFQADEARSKQADHGTGLGLSITKQIIERHGGNVEVYSKENHGTTVICSLPKVKKKGEGNET